MIWFMIKLIVSFYIAYFIIMGVAVLIGFIIELLSD